MKAFAWLMENKKVSTSDLAQNGVLCRGIGESINHFILFLHCPEVLTLWSKLFQLLRIDWVLPRRLGILSRYSNFYMY